MYDIIFILKQFTKELSQTPTFKYEYLEYCNNLQKNILNSLSDKQIELLLKKLPLDMKKELLLNMQSHEFLSFYQNYDQQEEKGLVKKLIKNKEQLP